MYEWIGSITSNERRMQAIGRALGGMPASARVAALWMIGLTVSLAAGRLRRTIRRNMRRLLANAGYGRVRVFQASIAFFGQFIVTIYECLFDLRNLPHTADQSAAAGRFIQERFELDGEQHLDQSLSQGRGAIVFAPHLGNFFYYYWLLSRKADCLAVATAGSEELRPIYLSFNNRGCAGLDYDDTPPLQLYGALQRHLARGGVVFLLGDFWRETFPVSSLFGLPNRSPEGAAMLALRTGAPVVPLHGRRMHGLRHRLTFGEPIRLQTQFGQHERMAATRHLNGVLEGMIASSPSQWLYWFNVHERWEEI